eukprot:TRINITY_DN2225_c0_g2_i1.p1 TRINITY_DN2225_c0_g2~~TRINITY_DN2225_c0_g2_i1.p1  ORF type:complete len:1973 (+),score=796.33 TRINITY_DN2225_c0_g2_i1:117-6035(+)
MAGQAPSVQHLTPGLLAQHGDASSRGGTSEFGAGDVDTRLKQLKQLIRGGNEEPFGVYLKGNKDLAFAQVEKTGATPLHMTVEAKEEEMCRMLLRKKADPKVANREGNTPLHLACAAGLVGIVKLLVQYGADLGRRNAENFRPADIARRKGHTALGNEIDKLILSRRRARGAASQAGGTTASNANSEVSSVPMNSQQLNSWQSQAGLSSDAGTPPKVKHGLTSDVGARGGTMGGGAPPPVQAFRTPVASVKLTDPSGSQTEGSVAVPGGAGLNKEVMQLRVQLEASKTLAEKLSKENETLKNERVRMLVLEGEKKGWVEQDQFLRTRIENLQKDAEQHKALLSAAQIDLESARLREDETHNRNVALARDHEALQQEATKAKEESETRYIDMMRDLQTEMQKAKRTVATQETTIASLEARLADDQAEFERRETLAEQRRSTAAGNQQKSIDGLQEAAAKLTRERDAVYAEVQAAREKVRAAQEAESAAQHEKELVEIKLKDVARTSDRLAKEIDDATKHANDMKEEHGLERQKQARQMDVVRAQFSTRCAQLEEEVSSLSKRLQEKEKDARDADRDAAVRIGDLENQAAQHERMLSDAERSIKAAEAARERAAEEIRAEFEAATSSHQRIVDSLNSQLEAQKGLLTSQSTSAHAQALQDQLLEAQAKHRAAEAQLTSLQQESAHALRQADRLGKECEAAAAEAAAAKAANEELEKTVLAQKTQLLKHEKDVYTLGDQLAARQAQDANASHAAADDVAAAKRQAEQAEAALAAAEADLQGLERKLDDARQRAAAQDEQIKRLEAQAASGSAAAEQGHASAEKRVAALQQELTAAREDARGKLADAETQRAGLLGDVQRLEEQLLEARAGGDAAAQSQAAAAAALEKQLADAERGRKALEGDLEQQGAAVASLEQQLADARAGGDATAQSFQEEALKQAAVAAALGKQLADLDAGAKRLLEEVERRGAAVAALERELTDARDSSAAAAKEADATVAELRETVANLKDAVDTREKTIQTLALQQQGAAASTAATGGSSNVDAARAAGAAAMLADRDAEIAALREEVRVLSGRDGTAATTAASSSTANDSVVDRDVIAKRDAEIQGLRGEIDALQAQLRQTEAAVAVRDESLTHRPADARAQEEGRRVAELETALAAALETRSTAAGGAPERDPAASGRRTEELETQVNSLSTLLAQERKGFETEQRELSKQVQQAAAVAANLKQHNALLTKQVEDMERHRAAATASYDKKAKEAAALESDVAALKAQVARAPKDPEALAATVAELRKRILALEHVEEQNVRLRRRLEGEGGGETENAARGGGGSPPAGTPPQDAEAKVVRLRQQVVLLQDLNEKLQEQEKRAREGENQMRTNANLRLEEARAEHAREVEDLRRRREEADQERRHLAAELALLQPARARGSPTSPHASKTGASPSGSAGTDVARLHSQLMEAEVTIAELNGTVESLRRHEKMLESERQALLETVVSLQNGALGEGGVAAALADLRQQKETAAARYQRQVSELQGKLENANLAFKVEHKQTEIERQRKQELMREVKELKAAGGGDGDAAAWRAKFAEASQRAAGLELRYDMIREKYDHLAGPGSTEAALTGANVGPQASGWRGKSTGRPVAPIPEAAAAVGPVTSAVDSEGRERQRLEREGESELNVLLAACQEGQRALTAAARQRVSVVEREKARVRAREQEPIGGAACERLLLEEEALRRLLGSSESDSHHILLTEFRKYAPQPVQSRAEARDAAAASDQAISARAQSTLTRLRRSQATGAEFESAAPGAGAAEYPNVSTRLVPDVDQVSGKRCGTRPISTRTDPRLFYMEQCLLTSAKVNAQFLDSLPKHADLVTSINIAHNYIGKKGIRAVLDVLALCHRVVSLDLADNKLENGAVMWMVDIAREHPSLASINLDTNLIAKSGGAAVLQLLIDRPQITHLSIANNPLLMTPMARRIQEQVEHNKLLASRRTAQR